MHFVPASNVHDWRTQPTALAALRSASQTVIRDFFDPRLLHLCPRHDNALCLPRQHTIMRQTTPPALIKLSSHQPS